MTARQVFAENVLRRLIQLFDAKEYRSIEHFALSVGLPNSLLSRIVNQTSDLRLSSMEKVAHALDVPLKDLLDDAALKEIQKKKKPGKR